jgi:P27 family predicted phage terminase small subunit
MSKRRTPLALKRLHGTVHPTRTNKFEPQVESELDPVPPNYLTPSQQASWLYVMRHAPRGLLSSLDRAVLVTWVEAEDRHRTAMLQQAQLDHGSRLPLLHKGKDGYPIPSPYLRIMNHAALIMLRCATELGFSPAARPRIQLIPTVGPALIEGEVDPWDELARDVN